MQIINLKSKILNHQQGFMVSFVTFLVLIIMLTIALTMHTTIFYRQRISTNAVKSTQAYYAAEAGAEEALLRLKTNPQMVATSYTLLVNQAATVVTIPAVVAGSRVIDLQSSNAAIKRNLQVVYTIDGEATSFHYGVQVGTGGLSMANGSNVQGNVFSQGNITGSGVIDNSVIVSGSGNKVDGPLVKGDALVHTCRNSTIQGDLTYVVGGTNTCAVEGSTTTQSNQIDSQPMPITQGQIDDWKAAAAAGQLISGNMSIGNNQTQSIGPAKITGDFIVGNGSTVKLTGLVYVQGNISLGNNAIIKLDASYGSLGGVIITDGVIDTGNSSTFTGSGQTGSYILVLSTNTSLSAIIVNNNASGAVFYTNVGGIQVSNNVELEAICGYQITMLNNAVVHYNSGLENSFFTDGPSGGWKVTSWKEY